MLVLDAWLQLGAVLWLVMLCGVGALSIPLSVCKLLCLRGRPPQPELLMWTKWSARGGCSVFLVRWCSLVPRVSTGGQVYRSHVCVLCCLVGASKQPVLSACRIRYVQQQVCLYVHNMCVLCVGKVCIFVRRASTVSCHALRSALLPAVHCSSCGTNQHIITVY